VFILDRIREGGLLLVWDGMGWDGVVWLGLVWFGLGICWDDEGYDDECVCVVLSMVVRTTGLIVLDFCSRPLL